MKTGRVNTRPSFYPYQLTSDPMSDRAVKSDLRGGYKKYTTKRIIFIAVFIAVVVALFFVSLTIGTRSLTVSEVYGYLSDWIQGVIYDKDTQFDLWYDQNIVIEYRLPRAIFAVIAGAGLAVAGAAMQSVMKNPLADPYTTGISSGALFGVAIAIILGFAAGSGDIDGYGTVTNALIFSMIPVLVIYLMSPYLSKSPATLILAGTAVSYLFSSLTDILLVTSNAEHIEAVYLWQVGSLEKVTWGALPVTFAFCAIGTIILVLLSNKLNLMSLQDKDAKALGLDSEKLRLVCLMVLSFMVASIISFVGIIGFVGLIVPHMVRLMIGADNRFVIPASIAVGGAFLLACDIIGRAIDVGAVIPVGVVTALIGSPIFLYLIIRQKREVW